MGRFLREVSTARISPPSRSGRKPLSSAMRRSAPLPPTGAFRVSSTRGTHQRNSIKGPGFHKVDLALPRPVSLAATPRIMQFGINYGFSSEEVT